MRLDLVNVTAGYSGVTALRDVSLSVPSGRVVALLGPNGAGKSTLLSVASGLVRPTSGRVHVDRRDVTDRRPESLVRDGLCHITEGRSIFPSLTVRENLRLFAVAGDESAHLERAVTAFPKLRPRLSQVAGTMSGGEQQMLALSRALGRRAPLVLLDEVSLGLAPIIVDEIFERLASFAELGASVLIVEQYVAKALRLADYVYVLAKGRIVFAGEPDEAEGSELFERYLGTSASRTQGGHG